MFPTGGSASIHASGETRIDNIQGSNKLKMAKSANDLGVQTNTLQRLHNVKPIALHFHASIINCLFFGLSAARVEYGYLSGNETARADVCSTLRIDDR
jgi:hypothetical protein